MVKNCIKVFARLKQEKNISQAPKFEISRRRDFEEIVFTYHNYNEFHPSIQRFRFHKIFDQKSHQSDVYETVAKPVVNRVLQGYNGTVFAYGQTGSGKTYSITGPPDKYSDRGIIPRSIQHIFEFIRANTNVLYNVYISYLEIYNEAGYDLLNPKHTANTLEELPRVSLLEDGKGEAHLKNLSVLPVASEQEAMRLLFLGDTNRSERVHKSNITGCALNEARYINLSLYYLEQVITALSESKRSHVPYRNSMMTLVLRDSLAGNCLTAMLATLTLQPRNLEETLSTCRFAQRVALVSTDAIINEEVDPQEEIVYLKAEIEQLKKEVILLGGQSFSGDLSQEQVLKCKELVASFLTNTSVDFPIPSDMRQVRLCFKLLRHAALTNLNLSQNNETDQNENLDKFKEMIKQRDTEISILVDLLQKEKVQEKQPAVVKSSQHSFEPGEAPQPALSTPCEEDLLEGSFAKSAAEKESFKIFISNPKISFEISSYRSALSEKYEITQQVSSKIEQCRDNIVALRKKVSLPMQTPELTNKLQSQLEIQQNIYRANILQMQHLKQETDHLEYGFQQAKCRIVHKFREWWKKRTSGASADIWTEGSSFVGESPSPGASLLVGKEGKPEADYYVDKNGYVKPVKKPPPPMKDPMVFGEERQSFNRKLSPSVRAASSSNNSSRLHSHPEEPEEVLFKMDFPTDVHAADRISTDSSPDDQTDFSPLFPNEVDNNSNNNNNNSTTNNNVINNSSSSNSKSPKASVQIDRSESSQRSVRQSMGYLRVDDLAETIGYHEKVLSDNRITPRYEPPPRRASDAAVAAKRSPRRRPAYADSIPDTKARGDVRHEDVFAHFDSAETAAAAGAAAANEDDILKNIQLTGDPEVDDEIINFYKARQNIFRMSSN